MKKLKDHIKWIILILLVAVISIILVGCLYVRKGYCLAWDVDLDYVATDTFVGILALICTNAVALITAILYYSSLKEQQKQTETMMKMMLYGMPLMMVVFIISSPAALGLYWLVGNVYSTLQSYLGSKNSSNRLEMLRAKMNK